MTFSPLWSPIVRGHRIAQAPDHSRRERCLQALSLLGLLAFAAVFLLGRSSAFHARLLAWNVGGWYDASFEGSYPAERSFRVLLDIFGTLALLWPLSRLFDRHRGLFPRPTEHAFLFSALFLGFLLRFDLWWTKSFWIDSYSLKAGLRIHSFSEILLGPLGFDQSAPVGFCLLAKAVGALSGWNDRAMTLPLFFSGLAVLALVPFAVAHAGAPRLRAPTALLVAISPQLVYYSAEFKQYGFDALFAALSLWASLDLSAGRRPRLLLVAVFVLGPFFSHTQFFLLPGLGLLLLWTSFRSGGAWRRPRRDAWTTLLLCGILGGIATLASLVHTVATMPGMMSGFWASAFPPAGSLLSALAWWTEKAWCFFQDPFAVLPVPAILSWSRLPLFLPVPALLLLGAAARPVRPAAGVTASALVLLVLAATLQKWPVRVGTASVIESRHLLFLLPLAFFFLALGLDRLRARCLPLALAVLLAAVPVGVSRLLSDRIYSWSMPDAVAELARRADGAEPILLGGYHHTVACAYAPDWAAANKDRIEVLHPDDPSAFASRLDELSADPGAPFWTLWAPRGKEGRILPGIFAAHLPGRRADFVQKTPAGILQHFPAP